MSGKLNTEICKICGKKSGFFSEASILNKYTVSYFRCEGCGFIQTEEPYWLEESYSEAINYSDIGLLKRNMDLINPTKNVINFFFKEGTKFIDYGAGYGVFVRIMRDNGYNFFWSDKYCENIYAKDFYAEEKKYDLLTAYEVFEHLVNPADELENMLKYSDNILFTTYLIPKSIPKPQEWWYYALDHGQHISLYSIESLKYLASKFRKNFYTNRKNIHIITGKKLPEFLFGLLTKPYISDVFSIFGKRTSLLDSDYKMVLNKLKGGKESGNS